MNFGAIKLLWAPFFFRFVFCFVCKVLQKVQTVRGMENHATDYVSVSTRIYFATKLFAKILWKFDTANRLNGKVYFALFQEHQECSQPNTKVCKVKDWNLNPEAIWRCIFFFFSLLKFNFHRLKLFICVFLFLRNLIMKFFAREKQTRSSCMGTVSFCVECETVSFF